MDIIERIKNDLETNVDSTIYVLDETEVDIYNQIKILVFDANTRFLDVILDEEDYKVLSMKVKDLNPTLKKMFLNGYLLNRILEKVGYEVSDDETVWFDLFTRMLKEKTNEVGKTKPRLHVFLDGIDNEILQTKINDLFSARGLITIGYRTKELSTNLDSHNQVVEPNHDYRYVESDKRASSNQRKRLKEIDICSFKC